MVRDRSPSPYRDRRRVRSRSRSPDRYSRRYGDDYRDRRDDYRREEQKRDDYRRHRDDTSRRESRRREDERERGEGRSSRGDRRNHSRSPQRERRKEDVDDGRQEVRGVASHGDGRNSEIELARHSSQQDVNNTHRAEPLSLEELLRKKEAEKAALARPVFMTKKDREAAALARRAEEAAAQRARVTAMRQNLTDGGQSAHSQVPTTKLGRQLSNRELSEAARKEERERERELELIKQQYLGTGRERKKAPKAAERFKFVFDWDAKEDTSRDLNPLYQNLHEATLLFGRGFRAGIDRREQRKAAADHETELLRLARERTGLEESAEDRRREVRRAAEADRYEGKDMTMDRHWSEKSREEMTERDWRIFREDYNISYKGSHIPMPLREWGDAAFPDPITKAIDRAGYKKPSPIQMAAIPLGLQQRDVIGIAETGSGKTAAFVLPMLVYILGLPPMRGHPEIEAEGPYAVVLAPTRELALQIEEETKALAQFTDFRAVSVVGGQSIEEQGFQLRKGCEIVVATPGRLVDCLARSYAVLNQCNYVVLDEADRMIDMGFEPQVVGVLDAMPSSNLRPLDEEEGEEEIGGGGKTSNDGDGAKNDHQRMDIDGGPTSTAKHSDDGAPTHRIYRTTTMFSATMPPAVERLARKYLRRPTVINIGATGKAADTVTQRVVMLKENEKAGFLEQELESMGEDQRIIVFVNTKRQCDAVARTLDSLGYRSTLLHGGKTQDQREESIKGFREDKYNVLVATDVAGRGIDVPNVALVINYDMPNNIEAYTHRIGRTGRAGRKGAAVTFITLQDQEVFYDLKKFLEDSNAAVPGQLAHHEAAKQKPGAVGGPPRRDAIQYAKK